MEFGDLSEDKDIQNKLLSFHSNVKKIAEILDISLDAEAYELLSLKDKVDSDLFMAYTLNTLFWLYLKTRGQDPAQHEVKDQLTRIKEHMIRAKEAHERQTIRPTLDKAAAERFIKHGISRSDNEAPACKKIRFED